MPASSSVSRVVVAAFVLASGVGVSAHRYDEFLQATRIGVESDRVRLEMSLTPGIAVASAAIRAIDTDGDGVFSSMERRAYTDAVLNRINVRVDEGPALHLTLADSNFPAPGMIRNGDAPISITLQAELPRLDSGAHHIRFRNDNATIGSVYLANALVSDTPRIAITSQHRDADQREVTIAFTLRGARPSIAQWGWIAAAAMLLVLPLARGRFRFMRQESRFPVPKGTLLRRSPTLTSRAGGHHDVERQARDWLEGRRAVPQGQLAEQSDPRPEDFNRSWSIS